MPDIDVTGYDNPATPGTDEGTTDVNGLIVNHPNGGVVSGTGGFQPFLRQNNNDGTTTGFNTSDPDTLADADDEALDMDATWTRAVKFGDLPIVMRNGIAYYEIRLDLNEPNNSNPDSGGDPNPLLELSEFQLYWSHQQATLADYTAGGGLVLDSDFHNVYDLDSGGVDRSLILADGPSGSGNDDYAFLIPVSAFDDAGPDDYLTLFAQFGPQPQEGATFEEFRLQNAFRITGTKYLDVNGDGARDVNGVDNVLGNGDDEVGLAGFTMYIDANHNNILDLGEVTAVSGASGSFAFYNLLAGTYDVREVLTDADISAAVKAANPDWEDYLPPSGIWDQTTGNLDGDHVITITTASQLALVGNHLLVPEIHLEKDATIAGGSANVANEVINYTLAVTNPGDVPLTGIVITDPYADASSIAAVLSGGFNIGDTNHNNALDLTETWQYTATHTVTQGELDSNGGGDGVLENTATVNSDQGVSDTDGASVPVAQSPSLAIDKTFVKWQDDGASGNAAGDVALYTVKITNTGNVTLTNVTVVDPLTGQNISGVTLAPGASQTYNTSYTLTQADLDNNGAGDGDIDNTATADSDQTNSVNDSAEAPISAVAAIDVEKSVMTDVNGAFVDADNPDGPEASTSSEVDFKVVLTNTGNVTLTDITLSDSVVHTVGGVAQAPVDIDYSDPALGAFIDLNGDGNMQAGEEWSAFDTNGDGTLDIDENGDPFELSVGETATIYYSLTSDLGQHENTVEVTTAESASDDDDANYFVLDTDDCVGVRTPGFWANTKWMTFWDAKGDGWGTAPNEPKQAGTPGFADGELLYGVDSNHDGFVNHVAGDGSNDAKPLDAKGLLIGDYNLNGITDAGEDTIFISLNDAIKLINASTKQTVDGKTADGIFMLGRDMVATWLNYLANNQDTTNECIGGVNSGDGTNTPREFIDAAIDWMQQFASTANAHDGNGQTTFEFDARVAPSSANWQNPVTLGEDLPVSAAVMHSKLDAYNNTGAINGVEYCCDADSPVALAAMAQII